MKMQCFFPKTSQTLMLNLNGHTKDYFIYNYEQKKILKMNKIQDFMGKRNLFFLLMFISLWASFAKLLHLEAPPEHTEKINKYGLSNIELINLRINLIFYMDML